MEAGREEIADVFKERWWQKRRWWKNENNLKTMHTMEAGQDGSKETIRGVNNKKSQFVEIFLTCIDENNESVTNKWRRIYTNEQL
jgi:hypothetical protein